jgi:hypothetical protein
MARAAGTPDAVSSVVSATSVIDTLLSLAPTTVTFPNPVAVGTMSASGDAQTVVLSNAAGARTSGLFTLTLADTVNFTIVGTTCPQASDATAADEVGLGTATVLTCTATVAFKPQTLGTGTFTTTLLFAASPGNSKTLTLTGTAVSALTITNATPVVAGLGATVDAPLAINVVLNGDAPQTSYIHTTLTGGNYTIVEDNCAYTKLTGGDSCIIRVAYLGAPVTPLKTGTLTVDGGTPGQRASVVLNSTTPPAP